MRIKALYDEPTATLTYVVYDPRTRDAVVIDPVLDLDSLSWRTSSRSVDLLSQFIRAQDLKLHWVLETHAHADHLTGAQQLKRRFQVPVAIGARITEVQETFKQVFDLPGDFRTDGSQFDRLLADGDRLEAGSLQIEAVATPGHTPACLTYKIGDALFTGDALLMDDYGTGRCDFPRGNANDLYRSIHDTLYAFPDATRVFVGHDYRPGGRELRYQSTIGVQKRSNPHLRQESTREQFVGFREARDKQLEAPRLLFPSVQINIDAGVLPPRQSNGQRYLRIPLNLFHPTDEVGVPEAAEVAVPRQAKATSGDGA